MTQICHFKQYFGAKIKDEWVGRVSPNMTKVVAPLIFARVVDIEL